MMHRSILRIRCLPTPRLVIMLMNETATHRQKIIANDELNERLTPEGIDNLKQDIIEDLRMQRESPDYKPKRFANVYKNADLKSDMNVKVRIPR